MKQNPTQHKSTLADAKQGKRVMDIDSKQPAVSLLLVGAASLGPGEQPRLLRQPPSLQLPLQPAAFLPAHTPRTSSRLVQLDDHLPRQEPAHPVCYSVMAEQQVRRGSLRLAL